jgi:hexosaminidase
MALCLPASAEPLAAGLLLAAKEARDEIETATGIRLSIVRDAVRTGDAPAIRCRLDSSAAISPRRDTARDAYRLRVRTSGIELSAPSPSGLRHGLQTLAQLASRGSRIVATEILDQPDFRDRGLMLDVSRGKVPTRKTLEDLVDLCCRLRLNVLMLYVEHTFDFRRHPEIGANASPLDAETLLALDAYAAERGVELVPCLQSLGHMERILSLDRYAHLAESDRLWSVSPELPATYALLGDLYDEFLPLFRSKRLNANCDEPFDLGKGRSAAVAKRLGTGGVFAAHIEKLRRLAQGHGKQLMIWADFALATPEHIDSLDRDNVLLDWWYEAEFDADRIRKLRRKGFEVWGCPGTSSWNCLFPRIDNAARNVARWADAGRAHGAKGLLNTDWGDFGHYNALGVSFHGYAWGAQHAWSGEPVQRDFDRAFDRVVFQMPGANLAGLYRKLGSIHDAGFKVFNGSALQYLYFDPLDRSYFIAHAKRRALEVSAKRIDKVLEEIDALDIDDTSDESSQLAIQEIRWAAQATRFSISKSLAGLDFNAWRESPTTWRAVERRALIRGFEKLAEEQTRQLFELERLWMARNAVSDFAKTRKRIRRSINSLLRGVKQLRENDPPSPAMRHALDPTSVLNEISGRKVR